MAGVSDCTTLFVEYTQNTGSTWSYTVGGCSTSRTFDVGSYGTWYFRAYKYCSNGVTSSKSQIYPITINDPCSSPTPTPTPTPTPNQTCDNAPLITGVTWNNGQSFTIYTTNGNTNCNYLQFLFSTDNANWVSTYDSYNCSNLEFTIDVPFTVSPGTLYIKTRKYCSYGGYVDSSVYSYVIESCTSLNLTSVSRSGYTLDFSVYFDNNNTNCYKVEGLWSADGTTWYNDAVTTHTGCTSAHIITTTYDFSLSGVYVRYFKLKKTCKSGDITYSNVIGFIFPESDFVYEFYIYKSEHGIFNTYYTNDDLYVLLNGNVIGDFPTDTGFNSRNYIGTMDYFSNIDDFNHAGTFSALTFNESNFLYGVNNTLRFVPITDRGGTNDINIDYMKLLRVNTEVLYFKLLDSYYPEWNHGTSIDITINYPVI